MKISAIIQARTNSNRLYGKVLKKINKKPLIQIQVERLKTSKLINTIILATTNKKTDDKLANFCKEKLKIGIFRGSEKNVLNRVFNASVKNKVDIIVECFGDSPLIDSSLIDNLLKKFIKLKVDVLTNALARTFPAGQEVTIYKKKSICKLEKIVKKNDILREHVGFNFFRYPEYFNWHNVKASKKKNFPNCYLEVDTKKDFLFLKSLILNMNNLNIKLNLDNIILFLKKRKDLLKINENVQRKWKGVYKKYIKI